MVFGVGAILPVPAGLNAGQLNGRTTMKRPPIVLPVSTGRTLQAPTKTVHGGVTGQKMQPITRGAGKPNDGKSGGGSAK
jgi:hypothetical protein